ncbi:MAG: metal ABC transporter solute-binding protein, Zn/Mn family [Gaiellaceae bacterium]
MTRTVLVCLLAAGLAACGGKSDGRLPVVASTNVYGDIARQIGGAHVAVTSVLKDPNADPHLFEPGTATGLAVAHARVVIENGLGYDAFMSRLEQAAPNDRRRVVAVADVLDVHGAGANPHLWYDLPRLPQVGAAIERALAGADGAHGAAYAAGLRRFVASLRPVRRAIGALRDAHGGAAVAYTEPVPAYLLQAAGLRNVAPSAFTRAIQQGSEPPPSAVSAMNALVTQHRIRVLLYNKQAVSPITGGLRERTQRADLPVLGVTETLPPGQSFQAWQLRQIHELQRALA